MNGHSIHLPEKDESSATTDSQQQQPADESSESRSSAEDGPQESDEQVTYPEGGLRAWSVVFGSFCGMMSCFGIMNSIGVFQAHLSLNQLRDYSEGTIGWIFGCYLFLSFFLGVQIGPVMDAKGPRLLVLAGSVFIMLQTMLLGVCSEYWHFLVVFGILGGFGTALVFTPAVASIGHFFMARRGEATGIAATGGSVGGIVFPLVFQATVPRIGFAWSTRVLGFICLVLLIFANTLVRSRLRPQKGASSKPDPRIFKDPVFSLATLGIFLAEWALFIPVSFLSSYAVASGFSSAFSYQLLAIFNAGSVFGRWLPGYVADKVGRFNTMILTCVLCLVSTLALWLPARGSVAMIIVYSVIFGFASGSTISLTPVCVGQLCHTKNYGRYYATSYTVVSFGTLCCIPIAGQILSTNDGKYDGLILFTGISYAGALAAFTAARVVAAGWGWKTVY